MAEEKSLIERLRNGEMIKCLECNDGYYTTTAKDIKISHEFCCNKCKGVIRITPNIIVE